MKRWNVLNKADNTQSLNTIINILFENRGIKTKKQQEEFLHPDFSALTPKSVGINSVQLKKALKRIKSAIDTNEKIVIFGDYDVDGVTGTAILWESLYKNYKNVFPYIPKRIEEGYGLSKAGISNILAPDSKLRDVKLIITVDNGIVAHDVVKFARENKIDVIVSDHHVPGKTLPDALAVVHTINLCGAGVSYMLSRQVQKELFDNPYNNESDDHLELVALATIADLVPLVGANRTLLISGLEKLRKTTRPGLVALMKDAGVDQKEIGVYEIGFIIGPRINAMGRLEYAMDSLRLLCTKNPEKALVLAKILSDTNRERQALTQETVIHAKTLVRDGKYETKKILFIANAEYEQGVIGLVAGKLVEEFYRPAIVISKGEKYSKASARSVSGFNIIEFIRQAQDLLVDAGGHPMAAGFTVETGKLSLLQEKLEEMAHTFLNDETLTRELRIDCELPIEFATTELFQILQQLSPFGMGNPEPVFVSRGMKLSDMRPVGADGKHLKLKLTIPNSSAVFDAIAFGMGLRKNEFNSGETVDVVYSVDENRWNGNVILQLKVRDMKKTN